MLFCQRLVHHLKLDRAEIFSPSRSVLNRPLPRRIYILNWIINSSDDGAADRVYLTQWLFQIARFPPNWLPVTWLKPPIITRAVFDHVAGGFILLTPVNFTWNGRVDNARCLCTEFIKEIREQRTTRSHWRNVCWKFSNLYFFLFLGVVNKKILLITK